MATLMTTTTTATTTAAATTPIATFMIDLVDYISGPVFVWLIFRACLCLYNVHLCRNAALIRCIIAFTHPTIRNVHVSFVIVAWMCVRVRVYVCLWLWRTNHPSLQRSFGASPELPIFSCYLLILYLHYMIGVPLMYKINRVWRRKQLFNLAHNATINAHRDRHICILLVYSFRKSIVSFWGGSRIWRCVMYPTN